MVMRQVEVEDHLLRTLQLDLLFLLLVVLVDLLVATGDGHVEDLHHGQEVNLDKQQEDQLVTITLHNLVMGMVEIPVVDTWVVLVEDISLEDKLVVVIVVLLMVVKDLIKVW
tara:strand:- start:216 stop:551 length:336 start_codon:yes stop_codon:yes gene_type:complete